MYSSFQLAKKYLHYWFTASSGKGHGIHSPFVFDFIKQVLNDKEQYPVHKKIEARRKELLQDNNRIEVQDFGAGSAVIKTRSRKISAIAASSLKQKKFAQLLYRIAAYYKPAVIVELGTSFGTTTSYLATGNPYAKVYSCEGAPAIAAIARQSFEQLQLDNIELTEGDFTLILPALLARIPAPGLVFIDGNHQQQPTLDYFQQFLQYAREETILVFDDIHWSAGMEAAWEQIKADPAVTLSIDLFFIGIILLRKDFKAKQHFTIRF